MLYSKLNYIYIFTWKCSAWSRRFSLSVRCRVHQTLHKQQQDLNTQSRRSEGGAPGRGGGAWERPVLIGSAVLLWVCLDREVTVDDADDRRRSLSRHTARNEREIMRNTSSSSSSSSDYQNPMYNIWHSVNILNDIIIFLLQLVV